MNIVRITLNGPHDDAPPTHVEVACTGRTTALLVRDRDGDLACVALNRKQLRKVRKALKQAARHVKDYRYSGAAA